MLEQGAHRRIEPVALCKLYFQAFGKVAGEKPDRFERLADGQHRDDIVRVGAKPLADFGHVGPHVAVVIQIFRQFASDDPRCGIGKGKGDLLADMVAQGDRSGRHVVHVEPVLGATAAGRAAARRLPLRAEIRP